MNCRMLAIVIAARNSDSGFDGSGAGISAASGPWGSARTSSGIRSGGTPEMSGTGCSSSHNPIGAINASLSTRSGLVAAISAATIPPKECPSSDTRGSSRWSSSSL